MNKFLEIIKNGDSWKNGDVAKRKELRGVAKMLNEMEKQREKQERDRYKPKRFVAENISVDAGVIVISDKKWFKDKGKGTYSDRTDLWKEFDVEKGTYIVDWAIPESWNGNVRGEGRLKIESGKMIVTDPCYLIEENHWRSLLDETDYLRLHPLGVVVLDKHGGDGSFTVNIKLRRRQ